MTKQLIHTDKIAFQKAIEKAQQKKTILENAQEEFTRLTKNKVADVAEFQEDFKDYTIKQLVDNHPEAKALGLKDHKILDLFDYDLSKLAHLNADYTAISEGVKFGKNNKIDIDVNKKDFEIYTETEEQNQRLEALKNFIIAVEAVAIAYPSHEPIIQRFGGYDRLIEFDLEQNKLIPFYGAIVRE